MMPSVARLRELTRVARAYGRGQALRKRRLLAELRAEELPRAEHVRELHEVLCFLRAYPDDPATALLTQQMLEGFEARSDLRRHRQALADSGIAGTALSFPFHWTTARWLAAKWPERLDVDFEQLGPAERERFERWLPLLLTYSEWPDFELNLSSRDWFDLWRGHDEAAGTFLVRRFNQMAASTRIVEGAFHDLALPLRVTPGPRGLSRTRLEAPGLPQRYRRASFSKQRPDLARALRKKPKSVRALSPREGTFMIELARQSLITRGRDLDGIIYANPHDVRLIDAGGGLCLACMGLLPDQRALVETIYVFLLLQNGVPIGYFQAALLFGSAEVNYHVFPTFRGAEAAMVYAKSLGVVRHLFGTNAFSVHPYQLGRDNPDALAAGAFWFYAKLGFRPEAPDLLRLCARELRALQRDPTHRTPRATLRRLASDYVFFHLGQQRDDVAGKVAVSRIHLAVSRVLAEQAGSDRERGLRLAARAASRMLGAPGRGRSKGERLAWRRWAPLVLALPGLDGWSAAERTTLAALILAKGGESEAEFATRLDRHGRLRSALLELARPSRAP